MARLLSEAYGVSQRSLLPKDTRLRGMEAEGFFRGVRILSEDNEELVYLHIGGGVGFVMGEEETESVPVMGKADLRNFVQDENGSGSYI